MALLWFSYIYSEVVLHQRNPDQGVWEQNRILLVPSKEPQWVSLWYTRKWFICWSSSFFPLAFAMQNMAKLLRKDIDSIRVVPWPPKVEELEQEEKLPPLIIKLLSALQGKKGLHLSPNTLALTSLITQYVTKKPTITAINSTITLHSITRSKELVDSFYKLGMGISYPNVLFLWYLDYAWSWTVLWVLWWDKWGGNKYQYYWQWWLFKWHIDWWRHCTPL